jgi:IclR family transcriptional regulator, KDG regulon repressor
LPDYTIGVVEDAIQVLEGFLDGKDRLTLAEITKESGLAKNKVFRILSTLEKHRLVNRDEAGAYTLGLRFLEFGQRVQIQTNLLEASRPVMDRLVQETAETIFLSIVQDAKVLVVDARESPRSIRLTGKVGGWGPLYAGGTPKVLLAFMPAEKRKALLDTIELRPITPYTITDRSLLEEHLAQIRQQGYVVTSDDVDVGAHSIAAPVHDYSNQVIAAISIAGPSHRFTDDCIKSYIELVVAGAAQISRALGYKNS